MSDLLREDEANRRRALELDSFIVEAPAGAGKTELLTQRYLRLLAIVDEPEEIIAITFTNKAAAEMRSRIHDSLALARDPEPPAAAHKRITRELARAALARSAERGWQIETQPGRLRLTTIDALCASLARQLPLLSRFGAQPAVADEPGRHYEEAARRALDHLEDLGAEGQQHADAVAVALAHLDNDVARLARLLAEMLARREQWRQIAELDDPEAAIGEALHEMVGEELGLIAEVLDDSWQAPWQPLARFAAAHLDDANLPSALAAWSGPLAAQPEELPRWRALADFLLTQKDEPRKTVTVRNGFPAGKEFKAQKDAMLAGLAALDAAAVAALRRVRELPAPDRDHDAVVRALARLMKLAAAELWLVFREAGEVDFGELSARAIAALGDELDPTDLGLRLDYRIRHLLVDEFQDTSPTQIDLLERLTAGWLHDDGRTLFAVGDPMQSIYRFRKADVGLFLRVAENGIGALRLRPLRLSRNNRSCSAVVDWINACFPAVFPAADDALRGEIAYREFVATRDVLPQAGVSVHPVLAEKDQAGRCEAQHIIALIETEWREDPTRSIAVLVHARKHLGELVAAIRRHSAGWRFAAVEIEPLAGRQAVQDLIALTRALHHRADRVHWLAILRAPWCGLRLADLHTLAGDDHAATIWSLINDDRRVERLTADGRRRLAHVRDVLAEALAGQGRQRRRRWIEDAWRKLGGPACLSGASEAADARAFFARLDALDAAGRFVLDRLADDMGSLYAAPDALADGRLQLMTIHKAKGLEFDTVILPGLHRVPKGSDAPLLAWDSFPLADGERLVAAPVNPRRGGTADGPSVYDFLQGMERERSRNEEARVLYVAATRAVRRLHLVGVAHVDEQGALVAPRAGAALARLWPAVEAVFQHAAQQTAGVPPESVPGEEGELKDFVPQLLRLRAPGVPPQWQAPALPTQVTEQREPAGDALAAALGTLTHAVLELIAADPDAWPAQCVSERQAGFERWLASRGWPSAEARTGAARVAAMLATTLSSADGQWVLRRRADAAAELALMTVAEAAQSAGVGGTVVTRVIDRSFVANGVRWIIDYKTVDLGDASDISRLKAHAERYRPQLETYAALFAGEGLPRRLGVLYVAHGILASLEYNRVSD
ncbi:MAG: hypothetical protein A2040_07200 [Rhodocyclales bacterium GWA2_65_19]|nr:MAG: hypothetical protein A2040_07200 [Rhodocyclales bacterium GWA2_65_19]